MRQNPVDVLNQTRSSQADIWPPTTARLAMDQALCSNSASLSPMRLQGDLGTSFVYGRSRMEIIMGAESRDIRAWRVVALFLGGFGGRWQSGRALAAPNSIAGRTIMGGLRSSVLPCRSFLAGHVVDPVFAVMLLAACGRARRDDPVLGLQVQAF